MGNYIIFILKTYENTTRNSVAWIIFYYLYGNINKTVKIWNVLKITSNFLSRIRFYSLSKTYLIRMLKIYLGIFYIYKIRDN